MKDNISRTLTRLRETFDAFTTGQKLVAVVGSLALLWTSIQGRYGGGWCGNA